jgi:tetratricopeptide (TPR) repeat protein/tRNA A-37 threonylcarbamoyl transferase component Bud32
MSESRIQSDAVEARTRDLTGSTVGRFVVEALLGRGGMGEVYRAADSGLKRRVALKRIAPELRADERSRKRLWREAESASRLSDPRVAAIYDVFEDGGELYVVMEYVEGQTLRRRLGQPFSIPEFLETAVPCAEALASAHSAGILHHDVKPENIMLTASGHVKMLDFGLARPLPSGQGASTQSSLAGPKFAGTVPYMAPEVLQEKEPEARSDIFSLGVVFYEALAGRNPFRAEGFLATCERVLHEQPTPLRQLNPLVPAELERIINKMLAKSPSERYTSAADLVVDLQALQRGDEPRSARSAPAPRGWSRSNKLITAAVLVVLIALFGVLSYRGFRGPVLQEHASVLATDFENQTGEKIFDQTAGEALREVLEQSRYIHIVPRAQLLEAVQRAGRPKTTHIDEALGLELCQRENYRALLTGRIVGSDSTYTITAQVLDPAQGAPVLTETASLKSPDRLYPAVDDLASRLRAHMGESLSQIGKNTAPLARVTTPSLPALQRYSRALDAYAAGDLETFFPLAKSAVELDPEFAMAHLYLAKAHLKLGNLKEGREQLAQAKQGLDRVGERERYLILAADYDDQGLYEKAVEQYELLVNLYPDDIEAYQGLSDVATWAGRPDEAISAEQQVLRLDPHSVFDYSALMQFLDRANRFTDALAAYAEARRNGLQSPVFHWGTGLAYLGLDDTESARREFELLGQEGKNYEQNLAALYSARVLMYEGRLREATETLRGGLVLDEKFHSESWAPVRHYLLAGVLHARGMEAAARSEARWLAESALKNPQPNELRRAGVLAVGLGDLDTAKKLLAKLGELNSQESSYTHSCYYNLKGLVELASGQPRAAVEDEQRASTFFPSSDAQAGLARAYEAQGDWKNAAQAYLRYLEFKGGILRGDSPTDWALAHLWVGKAFYRSGDAQQSVRYYDEFLRLWRNADPDLPALHEAHADRERLLARLHSNSQRNSQKEMPGAE